MDAVMAHVPKSNRCACDRNAAKAPSASTGNWFSRLFGRN
ncbi:hypothetical protein ART_1342 [Arthrobacter sp. PAMC 25486]|nr:hypothetical protein ART_1342 [Arthrobacter sp. PAMC 25486]